MPLEQIGLSARTFNSLRRSGITKVGELLERSDEDLLGLRSFGQISLTEVKERLETLDIKLIPPPEAPAEEEESVPEGVEEEGEVGTEEPEGVVGAEDTEN